MALLADVPLQWHPFRCVAALVGDAEQFHCSEMDLPPPDCLSSVGSDYSIPGGTRPSLRVLGIGNGDILITASECDSDCPEACIRINADYLLGSMRPLKPWHSDLDLRWPQEPGLETA
jgi:hypothetical protein